MRRSRFANKGKQSRRWRAAFGSVDQIERIRRTPCLACGRTPSDNAHVKPRSLGGTWKDVVPLCRAHHKELDNCFGRWERRAATFGARYGIDLFAWVARVYKDLQPWAQDSDRVEV